MRKTILAALLLGSLPMIPPASAQAPVVPKRTAARADACAPIGRTANGTLVYSMKCETLPAPPPGAVPPAPPQAQAAPEPEDEVQRSGFLGLSYTRKRPDQ